MDLTAGRTVDEAGAVSATPSRLQAWLTWPLAYALIALLGLAIGRSLSPDPRGFGTHESLGLPPCTFRYLTGLPCPGCGMTTAVAHAAHGDLTESFLVQPAGFLVGVGLWFTVPLGVFLWLTGLSWDSVVPRTPRHSLGWGVVVYPILLAAWVYKLSVLALG